MKFFFVKTYWFIKVRFIEVVKYYFLKTFKKYPKSILIAKGSICITKVIYDYEDHDIFSGSIRKNLIYQFSTFLILEFKIVSLYKTDELKNDESLSFNNFS